MTDRRLSQTESESATSRGAGLGTLLRHLIELLDGDVQQSYRRRGLAYRPRYTPVMRALAGGESASIRALASAAGLTHSAVSQTAAQMAKDGLLDYRRGDDGRERLVALSPAGRALLPELRKCWAATSNAADDLMTEIGVPLDRVLATAIAALADRSFLDRIDRATGDAHSGPRVSTKTRAQLPPTTLTTTRDK